MKKSNSGFSLTFWMLGLGAATAWAQPDQTPQNMVVAAKMPRVRPPAFEPAKQITQDLGEFAAIINEGKIYPAGQKWIHGARIGFFGASEWVRGTHFSNMGRVGMALTINRVAVEKIEDETASAVVNYAYAPPNGLEKEDSDALTQERRETLQFKLGPAQPDGERTWQIVPPDAPPANFGGEDREKELDDVWAKISFALAQKPNLKVANVQAKRSLSNLKQLSVAALQFVMDFDERYAFAPEYLQEALAPYLKNRDGFFVPDSKELFHFNPHLTDKTFAQLAEPARTVAFYEGEAEKPTFRYDDKAAIGFADGHVALVSPEEAKNLIWKP
ncbi:MAG TPA: hypothetical protein VF627_12240 [Abditibacterium sp.]|jgi:prepilin-type processing-associated H-X9-DG protein